MISTFQIKKLKSKDFKNNNIKTFDYLFVNENLATSKIFWISSIYLFLSITLLTGLHMYEYFKCFLC